MQPSHHASDGSGMVVLDELMRQPQLAELVLPEGLHEEPATVLKYVGDEHSYVAE
jgi:hypothetical protein